MFKALKHLNYSCFSITLFSFLLEAYKNTLFNNVGRFIHPIVYGEYPQTMQNIVKDRLPKFTEEEVKMVKGSIDFVGINQYTTYFMSDTHNATIPKELGYQQDWNATFGCKFLEHSI